MAQDTIGFSFFPGQDDREQPLHSGSVPPSDVVQEAIRVLALRLPRVIGGRPIAAAPLLESMGGAGAPHANSLVAALMRSLGVGTPPNLPRPDVGATDAGIPRAPSPPPPHITPGGGGAADPTTPPSPVPMSPNMRTRPDVFSPRTRGKDF